MAQTLPSYEVWVKRRTKFDSLQTNKIIRGDWAIGKSLLDSGPCRHNHAVMELSQFTDYSLRVLLYVSLRGKELSSVKEIASAYAISRNHLVKVVHNLAKLGYLDTFRGKGGGIILAKSPKDIGVGELVRATESLAILECFPSGKGTCCIAGICELQNIMGKALQAFMDELDKVTLADLMKRNPAMRDRLKID